MSVKDKKALEIMQRTKADVGNRYQLSLPWRYDPRLFPNNLPLATSRLLPLKRRLEHDHNFYEHYTKTVQDYIDKGFARYLSEDELMQQGWYIPHQGVTNVNKPGKVHVVFDCSAKFNGVSLNDALLHGPDMTNNLVGVLTRFRQERICIISDIEAMFHQVLVTKDNQNYLRFLWWKNGDLTKEPSHVCQPHDIARAYQYMH